MASKDKRRAGPAAGPASPPARQEVDRLIAKGRYKDAVKEAKICFRREPTEEHRRLLERAYYLRAEQLRAGGMPAAAQEVAGHLLEFGISDPGLTEPAAALLVAVGLAGPAMALQGRLDDPGARERLTRRAADQAVLHPDRAGTSPAEIREGARRVREALEAAWAGGEGTAEGLRDVARGSPFADWKLFARGLAALRKGEREEARANWGRLDPDRAASKIARALRAIDGDAGGDGPAGVDLGPLERWAFGAPVLGPLRELGEAAGQGRWDEAVRMVSGLRFALRQADAGMAVRLTLALYHPLIREATGRGAREGRRLLKDFTRVAEPIPIDPRWNRLWALAWEGPQGHIEEAEPYWRKYLDDLGSTPAIRPGDRPRARGLVLRHVGEGWADLADEFAPPGVGAGEPDPEAAHARRRAVACFEEALRLDPENPDTYRTLLDAHESWGEPDRAADAARRLLRICPDDVDALTHLANYHFRRDEPAESLGFARRARAIRPLDPGTIDDEWAARVALARRHALDGRFEEGRAELEAAEALRPGGGFHFAARRAALEIKASEAERAEAIIAEATRALPEPTPFWLALAIEAVRFQLPKAERQRFESLWDIAASRKCRGETAGALAELLASFVGNDIAYPGRDAHLKEVLGYLRRAARVKYAREDLGRVCALLGLAKGEGALLEKMAGRGLRTFPDAPEFPMILGSIAMQKGLFRGDLDKARRYYEKALALAQPREATDPKAARMLPAIKDALTGLAELTSAGPPGFPFGGGRGGRSLLDAMAEMMEAEGIDPDDLFGDDGGDEAGPAPRPRRKGKR
jgi:tetratricopeptide (TPR) repeat protein